MTDREYELADNELFAMVNGVTPTGGKTVGVVVSVARARELEGLEMLIKRIWKTVPIAEHAGAAAIFFAAAILGWMDLTFGFIVALIAAARAASLFWRLRHGKRRTGK